MLTLLKIYVDILALRKGPDAIPHSRFILALSIGMLVLSSIAAAELIDGPRPQNQFLTYSGYSLGLLFYGSVLFISGFADRMMQTISAIIACGAIITMLYVAGYVVLSTFFGNEIAGFVGLLIILWSVPVEGHIIARAIQQHWFVGITIAMAALILQLGFQSAFADQ